MVYIYDTLLYPVDVSNPIYPYVQIRESVIVSIVPIIYRLHTYKISLNLDMIDIFIKIDSEADLIYTILNDNDIISRKAGSKRFSYTHRWIREKMIILDQTMEEYHTEHTSGFTGSMANIFANP